MICWAGDDARYQKFIQTAIDELKPHASEFDGIVSAGLSGLLVAAPVAFALKVPLGVVRRTCDGKHGGQHANLNLIKRALFIDDHFGGGNTFRACRAALAAYTVRDHEIVAIYMYNKGKRIYDGYHHVTSPSMERIQGMYTLWPPGVYEKLHDPGKSEVKKAVKKVARDAYGRFAPKDAASSPGEWW